MNSTTSTDTLELEVLRNPSNVRGWLQFIRSILCSDYPNQVSKANAVNVAYERALRANGYSYKLWMGYISYRRENTRELTSPNEWFRSLRDIYDRAVEKLPMMPLLWTSFIEFAMDGSVAPRITLTRHVITRALEALPFTQHHRIWRLAKLWVSRPHVPMPTATYIWRLYLLYDPSTENQRNYFHMLWEKGNASDFLVECAAFLLRDSTSHGGLLRDIAFWETVRTALETKGLCFGGDISQVEKIVQMAADYCASPAEFRLSYAVFLANQGELSMARETLWAILNDVDNPAVFCRAFTAALAFESQIIDSLAMDSSIHALDEVKYQQLREKLCGDVSDPLYHLTRLTQQHPMLLNQLQLRADRHCTALWLKRIEILKEMECNGVATSSDVIALYRQAITQCTSGMPNVEAATAQLFESYACYLWENNLRTDAVTVADEGAWFVKFSSTTSNVLLMGLVVEFSQLTDPARTLDKLVSRLVKATNVSNSIRSKGLARQVVVKNLARDPRAWVLAVDVAFHRLLLKNTGESGGRSNEELKNLISLFCNSSGYTAEGACYVACRLWQSGDVSAAFQEFERALVAFAAAPLAVLHILQQYLSCLCVSFGTRLPLHRFREFSKLGLDVAQFTMRSSPVSTVEFLLNCVTLESRLGFSGSAVQIARECLHLALKHQAEYDSLLFGVLDAVLEVTFRLHGSQALRHYCAELLERQKLTPQLIQRLALWWAAVERRTGNADRAHTVMEACCKSQDPSSSHGAVFWSMWESICNTVKQFEGVHRRKQQAALKYSNGNNSADAAVDGFDGSKNNNVGASGNEAIEVVPVPALT